MSISAIRAFAAQNRTALMGLFLFFAVEHAFVTCLRNQFVNYDDGGYVYGNLHVVTGVTWHNIVQAFTRSTGANWHPLTMLTHMVDCQLFGLSPWGHHLLNVILHSLNTVLAFLLFRLTTGTYWRACFVALFFGLHPLRVESVAWISERKDVLSTFFWMLSAIAYTASCPPAIGRTPRQKRLYVSSLFFFGLGLMCKPMLVTLPCVLLLMDLWPLGRLSRKSSVFLLIEKLPFFIMTGVISATTVFTQADAMIPVGILSHAARIENMVVSYCRYMAKIVYPVDLTIFYPYRIPDPWSTSAVVSCALILYFISVLALMQRRQRPYILVGWLWFLGGLFPVIGLAQVGSQSMADRYSYVPSIGIFIVLVWLGCELHKRFAVPTPISLVLVGVIATLCFRITRVQITYWKDDESLWRHAVAVTENNYMGMVHIGAAEMARTNYEAAITNWEKALSIKGNMVDVRLSLGTALTKMKRFEEAINTLRLASLMEPTNAHIRKELATALIGQGRQGEAITNLMLALKYQSNFTEAKIELQQLTGLGPAGNTTSQ